MEKREFSTCLVAFGVLFTATVLVIPCIWSLLYFGYGNYTALGHQEFAVNGLSQIEPASQMDDTFEDCRHYITYADSEPLFNSVAYLGNRYKLKMQVPVSIESATSGSTIGEPEFHLIEISNVDVSSTGQISVSSSRSLNFGPNEWKQVYDANGDFNKIGFTINPTPVANFQRYADASRPTN